MVWSEKKEGESGLMKEKVIMQFFIFIFLIRWDKKKLKATWAVVEGVDENGCVDVSFPISPIHIATLVISKILVYIFVTSKI